MSPGSGIGILGWLKIPTFRRRRGADFEVNLEMEIMRENLSVFIVVVEILKRIYGMKARFVSERARIVVGRQFQIVPWKFVRDVIGECVQKVVSNRDEGNSLGM